MASTSSSSPPEEVPETHCRRSTKRARINDGSRPAAEPTMPAPTGHSSWRDWESLACGPATVIADRLVSADIADYIRFRAVCSAWRGCTADPHADVLDRRFYPNSWSMLNDIIQCRGAHRYCRFVNLSTGQSVQMAVPGRNGRTLLVRTSQGLLVLLSKKTKGLCVVNPITGAHADLPPVTRLLHRRPRGPASPRWPDEIHFSAEVADDSAVAINFGGEHGLLGVARPGDERWAKVKCGRWIRGLLSSAGRVYCCSGKTVMVLETSPNKPPGLVKAFTATSCWNLVLSQ